MALERRFAAVGSDKGQTGTTVGRGRNVVAVAIATACAEAATLPICMLKSQVQNTPSLAILMSTRGIGATAMAVHAQHDLRAFFRASQVSLASQVLSTSLKYALYSEAQRRWNPDGSHVWRTVGSALGAGVATTVVTHPLDVVKIHRQMVDPVPLHQKVAEHGAGWRGYLYRGYAHTLAKASMGSVLFFPLFEAARGALPAGVWNATAAAFVSGVVSTCILHPLDCAKTRASYGRQWWFGCTSLRPYYTGLSFNLLRVCPHFTLTMGITKALEQVLR